MLDRALLIFPGQFLTRTEQDDFARRFGALEFTSIPISNLDKDGNLHTDPAEDRIKSIRGNEGWHHDSTFKAIQAKGAVFTAEIVPADGGDTGWADMAAAYDALDDETRALVGGLTAYHSLLYSQQRAGYLPSKAAEGNYEGLVFTEGEAPLRPLVKVHPDTGRPNLLIGRHAHDIPGMDVDESTTLLDRLIDEACQPPRVHHHQWTVGDAVVWDNRRLLHQATPFDLTQPRLMWHTRIAGERATELALNQA